MRLLTSAVSLVGAVLCAVVLAVAVLPVLLAAVVYALIVLVRASRRSSEPEQRRRDFDAAA